METKNLKVFFLAVMSLLVLASFASAATTEIATVDSVKINGMYDFGNEDISVIAGETITIEVAFTAEESASDVKIEVELEGEKEDVDAVTKSISIKDGSRYRETLTLRIPYELQDDLSLAMALNIKIWNGDYKTEHPEITLSVQRPTYNADVMSISSNNQVSAGDLYAIDVVVKNNGYNKLDDVYVTAKISALNVERISYFGDLVSLEDEDNEDSESGRFYLAIPYNAESGLYTLEVEVKNGDLVTSEVKQILIENDFSSNVVVTDSRKIAAAGQEVSYELLIVNPTNKLKVYRVVVEGNNDLTADANMDVVAVPAGLTKMVTITAEASSEGEHEFNAVIFSGEEIVETVALSLNADGKAVNGSVIALTVVLLVVFLVLLAVLVILIGKKSKKAEDFGESYY
jgi:hypothetical protein